MRTRCALVRWQLPSSPDGSVRGSHGHVETCLRCQAELAKYRSLQRRLAGLAAVVYDAPVGMSAGVLAEIEAPRLAAEEAPPRRTATVVRVGVAAAAAGAAMAAATAVALGVRRHLAA